MRVEILSSLGVCGLAISLQAEEVVTCKSPDGKFALRCVYADKQPYNGDAAIVEMPARKTVLVVDPNWTLGNVKLLWSADSQRCAYFSEKGNDYTTRVFFPRDSSFDEIPLPDLPSPKLPPKATASSETKTWTEPISWSASHDLTLEKELLDPNWGRTALKITLGFDQENRATLRSAEQEKMSIVDYFMLLPAKNFEAPLSSWLRQMRMGGFFELCDAKQRKKNIDEKNGYMHCDGDGAQPSFEVALFRYRDGRPLLAVCSAELEADDSSNAFVYLSFFELGADGKMQETKHSIFPVPDREDGRWNFELPREGRTIAVRAREGGKILNKITWNGEKFQKEK